MKRLNQVAIGSIICVFTILIYVIQFVIIPKCCPSYFPVSTGAYVTLWVPPIVLALIVAIAFRTKIFTWAIVDSMYFVLMAIYNGRGLYNFGIVTTTDAETIVKTYKADAAMVDVFMIALILFVLHATLSAIRNKLFPEAIEEF